MTIAAFLWMRSLHFVYEGHAHRRASSYMISSIAYFSKKLLLDGSNNEWKIIYYNDNKK
jgi:hypothetical protein